MAGLGVLPAAGGAALAVPPSAGVEKASAVAPDFRSWTIESLTRARVRSALGDRSGAIDAYRAMTRLRYQSDF